MTVDIEFAAANPLSYSMAHNQIPIVPELHLLNRGPALESAVLVIEVVDDEGVVSHPFTEHVALPTGEPVLFRQPPVRLDPAALLQVHDPRPGQVVVRVLQDDNVLGSSSQDVTLMAGNQWCRYPEGLGFELLSSFVLPNDPAVAVLLREAAAVLDRSTGHPTMEGYQSDDPARVDAMVAAVWEAAQRRDIRYVNPPASWNEVGQRIRTPAEVFDDRLGTCLDTTVTLAAALEQIGLNPLIWVLESHAFLGYWRDERLSLGGTLTWDGKDAINAVDLGHIRLVETTAVTSGGEPVPFDLTQKLALSRIQEAPFIAAVDVRECRRVRIFPLPVRRQTEGGVEITEYRAAEHSPRQFVFEKHHRDQVTTPVGATPARVQQWKNSLLDLSLRNRLINYTDRAGVRIRVPSDGIGLVEDLLSAQQPLTLLAKDQITSVDTARGASDAWSVPEEWITEVLHDKQGLFTDATSESYLTRMRGLAYKARTIQEESGANNLYLALGSLIWNLDGRDLRSPLILLPVKLTTRSRGQAYRLELDESGGSTPNFCLLEKLRQVHNLIIPELANPVEDQSGIDMDATLRVTREAIARAGISARVDITADLSILQFAKFRLWKDLDEHWEALSGNALVRHLIHTPAAEFDDPAPTGEPADLDALDAICPVPADASQLEAVAEAVAGRTFVLEGPPGTGKSQTITNLLTRAVAAGKRVLFVAEKRAALDVVSSRLASVGMGPFCLDLHDKGSKPAVVRGQIKQALEHAVAVDLQGVDAHSDELRSSRRALARYAQRLHDANSAGLSYYSARTELLALGEGPTLAVPDRLLSDSAALDAVKSVLKELPDVADPARPGLNHPWSFVAIPTPSPDQVDSITRTARDVDSALAALPTHGPLVEVLRKAQSPEDIAAVAHLSTRAFSLSVLDATRAEAWHTATAGATSQIDAFASAPHAGLDVATPEALDLPLKEIGSESTTAENGGFFGRGRRRKAVLARLQPALRPGATVKPRDVPGLAAALAALSMQVDSLREQATGVPGIAIDSASWNPFHDHEREVVGRQVRWLARAGEAVAGSSPFVHELRSWVEAGQPLADGERQALLDLSAALSRLAEAASATGSVWITWSADAGLLDRWSQGSDRRSAEDATGAVRRWCALQHQLDALRAAGLPAAADDIADGRLEADDAERAFRRGIAQASLAERSTATGLVDFDAHVHDRVVSRFAAAVSASRHDMASAIPDQVLSARPFNAAAGRGQIGQLARELAKQRRGLGVRALMGTYGELVTQLMPCVLVSPDSVARFFPVGAQRFDLVVFDEASQIRVADAIGAMGRATSVVVVGDSKQMPPTSFAEPSIGADDEVVDETEVTEEQESILSEATLANVPRRMLTWHYRSQDESLIAFSNENYYDNKLSSFPSPSHAVADRFAAGVGVSMVRLHGTFQRSGKGKLLRTNPVEAEAIFAEIKSRFAASPGRTPSLGVITFNQQQRAHIEALIRDSQDERLLEALDGADGEGLFVKNLENVQGDERDVILFSTAFSANERGVLPLNFGPLTRTGGERRLNVAVTRARRQVVLYTSFDPSAIRVEQTQSRGVHHLRAYLELAAYGTKALGGAARATTVVDRHRDDIATALRQHGIVAETDVGLSGFRIDLTLAPADAPDRPTVAVLLDGPGWASRRTVGDRDGLPVEVLGNLMGWRRVERVWMPSWLADPDSTITHLLAAVDSADRSAAEEAPPDPAPVVEDEPATVDEFEFDNPFDDEPLDPPSSAGRIAAMPAAMPSFALEGQEEFHAFQPHRVGGRDVLDALPSPYATDQVGRVIAEIIHAEGPVHGDRLVRLAAACFDLTRLNQSRIDDIVRAIPRDALLDPDEPVVWPRGRSHDEWAGFRVPSVDDRRPLEHIPLQEIGNAMVAVCRSGAGMHDDELATETLAIFGLKRRTTAAQERLTQAQEATIAGGRLRRTTDGRLNAG